MVSNKFTQIVLMIFFSSLFYKTVFAAGNDDFIFKISTSNSGSSSNTQFTIPTEGTGYDYNIDCNDSNPGINIATAQTGNYICNYSVAGFYTIRISDNIGDKTGFPRIYFNDSGDKLKILNIVQWGTGKWISMKAAFSGASNMILTASDVPDFSQVVDMSTMFLRATLVNPNTTNWDVSNVFSMALMFTFATSANPDVSGWDTANVTDMLSMFFGATLANPDVSNWDTSSVTDMAGMFSGATLAKPNVSNWNTAMVTRMNSMFFNATSANPIVSSWNTANVTDMSRMFSGAILANPNVGLWNTANVTRMGSMFKNAPSANPIVSAWNTANVTDMRSMFSGATLANPSVSNWNTANVTNMRAMFFGAHTANPDVSHWQTANVTDMSFMFAGADIALPDVTNWNTINVTNMEKMFSGATFSNPNVSLWDTSKVINMSGMFSWAISANPDVSNWDTAMVTNMSTMFNNAISANPNLLTWDITGITTPNSMSHMFDGLTLSTTYYDKILISFNSQMIDSGIEFGGGDSKYCTVAAHNSLAVTHGWVIFDAGLAPFCYTSSDFVITVDTSNAGSSTSTQFTIPTAGTGYNYNIYCDIDDATAVIATDQTGDFTCDYATPGIYTIRIADNTALLTGFPRIYFNNTGDKAKIIAINQWGSGIWTSMNAAFYGASKLVVKATDTPNLSNVMDLSFMFAATALANPDTSGWNTSNINNMSAMFASATSANPDTSGWVTENVTDMSNMFLNATSARPDTSSWDVTSVSNMTSMFLSVTLPTPVYDAIITSFNAQMVQFGINFHGGNSKYCAIMDHDNLDNVHGWVITDGGEDTFANCSPIIDSIFTNGFENIVIFRATETQFNYDFSKIFINDLDELPLLIAKGLDDNHNPIIQFYLRNDLGQLQIRMDNIYPQDYELNDWIVGEWQNIDTNNLTTISW